MSTDTLYTSIGGSPPRPGTTVNMLGGVNANSLNDSERLRRMVASLSPTDLVQSAIDETAEPEGPDDDEQDLDLDTPPPNPLRPSAPVQSSSQPLTAPPTTAGQEMTQADVSESYTEDQSDADEEDSGPKTKMYIIAGIALVALIVIILIIRGIANSKDKSSSEVPNAGTGGGAGIVTPATTEQKFSADVLEITDPVVYVDSMVIDKYIVLDKDSCRFVFEGYAENARAFVKADVSVDVYNVYKVGARVRITYERITLNGQDYYMKVRVIQNED